MSISRFALATLFAALAAFAAAGEQTKPASIETQVDKLIAEYRTPPAPAEPTAAEKADIEKMIRELGADAFETREAASASAVKLGAVALPALRKAAAGEDMEVTARATKAVADIERTAREKIIERIKALPEAADVVRARLDGCRKAWGELAMAVPAAERDGKTAEVEKMRADMAALEGLIETLKAIAGTPAAAAAERDSSGSSVSR